MATPVVEVKTNKKWVITDFTKYTNPEDVVAYLESLWPSTIDTKYNRKLQHFDIRTLAGGKQRVWAERRLRDDEVKALEDKNNVKSRYPVEDDDDSEWEFAAETEM